MLKAGRCNNHLDVSKLQAALPDVPIPDAQTSIRGVFARMRDNLKAVGPFPPPPRKVKPAA